MTRAEQRRIKALALEVFAARLEGAEAERRRLAKVRALLAVRQ
jgi:hypothetical protein